MRQKIINGTAFELSDPYSEGHVCNVAEARVLNQVRSENIGNNLRSKIKDLLDAGDTLGAQAAVAEADKLYTFNHATVTATSKKIEPVEREALTIARDVIKRKLAETGRKIDSPPDGHTDESWAAHVDAAINQLSAREEVLALARETVAKRQALVGTAP